MIATCKTGKDSGELPTAIGLFKRDELSSKGEGDHKKKLRVAVPDGHLWESTAEIFRRGGYPLFDCTTGMETTGREFEDGRRVESAFVDSRYIQIGVFRPQKAIHLAQSPPEGSRFHLVVSGVDITTEDAADGGRSLPYINGKLNDLAKLTEDSVTSHFDEMGLRCDLFAGARPTRLCMGLMKNRYGVGDDFITPEEFMEIVREHHHEGVVSIATEYPNIAQKYCQEMGLPKAVIIPSSGLTENYIFNGVTDFILDTIETGSSRRKRGIATVMPGVIASGSVVVTTPSIYETVLCNGLGGVYRDLNGGLREGLENARKERPDLFKDGLKSYLSGN